jgi:hypothetical protein
MAHSARSHVMCLSKSFRRGGAGEVTGWVDGVVTRTPRCGRRSGNCGILVNDDRSRSFSDCERIGLIERGVALLPVRSWNLGVEFRLDRPLASGGDHAPTTCPRKCPPFEAEVSTK